MLIVIMIDSKKSFIGTETMMSIVHILIIAICILIVAIPEGMPLAVSLAMALSIDRLKEDSILIKNLEAIQVCATLHDVCVGKTGTLTQSNMNVEKVTVASKERIFDYHGEPTFLNNNEEIDGPSIRYIIQAIIGGTDAYL
jgi:P-type E1-E2 ATPase